MGLVDSLSGRGLYLACTLARAPHHHPPTPPPTAHAQVLRASKESLLTVVEVFIHDPLYKWALTTTAANRRQQQQDGADDGPAGANANEVRGSDGRGAAQRVAAARVTAVRGVVQGLVARTHCLSEQGAECGSLRALTALGLPAPAAALLQDDDGAAGGGAAATAAGGGGGGVTLVNADAERTLLRVKQKLDGVESGGWDSVWAR